MQFKQLNYSPTKKLFYAWFEAMFTRIDIAISVAIDRTDLINIISEIELKIKKYEQIANRFDPTSELSFVNNKAFENKIAISAELYEILNDCKYHSAETLGYFDISVYSKPRKTNFEPPFYLDPSTKTIQFSDKGVFLDLSGFLKGFVLKKIIEIIENKEIEDILINVGNSSIYAKGNHPFGIGWKIQIPETQKECVLQNECLTTSGNTSKTKWNIINPLTLEKEPNKKSVSLITKLPDEGEVISKVAYIAPELLLESILTKYKARLL